MTNLEKVKYIDGYNVFLDLNHMVNSFSKKEIKDKLLKINVDVKKQFDLYSEDIYNQYLDELKKDYENDMKGFLDFMMYNLSETASKFMLFKEIILEIE